MTGVAFAVTACAYGVMAVKQLHAADTSASRIAAATDERREADANFVRLVDTHGPRLMLIELAILAVTTVGAIGTDRIWSESE